MYSTKLPHRLASLVHARRLSSSRSNRGDTFGLWALLLSLGLAACSNDDAGSKDDDGIIPDTNVQETSDDDDDETTTGDDDDDDDDDDDADDDDDDDDDAADTGDIDGDEKEGCKGIDFLVIIDNSRSMEDEQTNLSSSFPKFLTTLQEAVSESADTFHVMILDTDSDACEVVCEISPMQGCMVQGVETECDKWVKPDPNDCDFKLGGARIKDATETECGVTGKQRYIISDKQDNLADVFACLGKQGTSGSPAEKPLEAMTNALSEEFLGDGGCNEGFVRPEAMLVVMVITDEEDNHGMGNFDLPGSTGEPPDWYKAAVAAKGGDPKGVMAIGLIGDVGTPMQQCQELNNTTGAERSPRLVQFFDEFGEAGSWGSVCADDYTPFLEEMVNKIDMSCDDWIPPE